MPAFSNNSNRSYVLLVFWMNGCSTNYYAVGRLLGSFWRHILTKSIISGGYSDVSLGGD